MAYIYQKIANKGPLVAALSLFYIRTIRSPDALKMLKFVIFILIPRAYPRGDRGIYFPYQANISVYKKEYNS